MQLMRHFWDAARALDPRARELDEGVRFRLCGPGPLQALFSFDDPPRSAHCRRGCGLTTSHHRAT